MHFLKWLSLVLMMFAPYFSAQAAETDHFRQCANCSVNELDTFFNDAVQPFESFKLTHPEGSKGPAVLFHGLGDSPYYMKDIAELYYRNGYDVYVPLLKAHGDSFKEMASVTYVEWNKQAEVLIQSLSDRYDSKVQVAGLSNGGLIGTVAALNPQTKERIQSLLLLSPAFGLPTSVAVRFKAFRTAEVLNQILDMPALNTQFQKLLSLKVRDNLCQGCGGNVRLNSLPLNGPAQLLKNAAHLKNADDEIKIPMIMVLTSDDKTISLSTAVRKFKSLFSGQKKLVWIQSRGPKTARAPKDIPPGQMVVIHSNEELSHVITLKTQGLAKRDEVNSRFTEMSSEVEPIFSNTASSCVHFYK